MGFYELAIIGNIFIFLVIALLDKFDTFIYRQSKAMQLYVEIIGTEIFQSIITYARENDFEVKHIQFVKNKATDSFIIGTTFTLKTKKKYDHSQVITDLSQIKGVSYIEEL